MMSVTIEAERVNVFYRESGDAPLPKTIIFWSRNDIFLTPGGDEVYPKPLPEASPVTSRSRILWP
jgi:hypothetical protein